MIYVGGRYELDVLEMGLRVARMSVGWWFTEAWSWHMAGYPQFGVVPQTSEAP